MKITDAKQLHQVLHTLRREETAFEEAKAARLQAIADLLVEEEEKDDYFLRDDSIVPYTMYVRDVLSAAGFHVGLREAKTIAEHIKSRSLKEDA
jgi:hypothetical protein